METDDSVVTAEPSTAVESIAKNNSNKLKNAKSSSSGYIDFFFVFSFLTVGTVGCTIVTALVIALPIAMIVIGAVHRKNCPASSYIAIWLIEWGTMTLARKCAFLLSIDISGNDEKKSTEQYNAVKYSTLDLLIGWWPLIGGILVFEIYKPDYENKFSENYCHYTLYSFSFILVTMAIVSLIITAISKIYKFFKVCVIKPRKGDETKPKKTDAEAGEVELNES